MLNYFIKIVIEYQGLVKWLLKSLPTFIRTIIQQQVITRNI